MPRYKSLGPGKWIETDENGNPLNEQNEQKPVEIKPEIVTELTNVKNEQPIIAPEEQSKSIKIKEGRK